MKVQFVQVTILVAAVWLTGCYSGPDEAEHAPVSTSYGSSPHDEITESQPTGLTDDETSSTEEQEIQIDGFINDSDLTAKIPPGWFFLQEGGFSTAASFPSPHSGAAEIQPEGLKISFLPYLPSLDPANASMVEFSEDWVKNYDDVTKESVVFYTNENWGMSIVGSKKGSSLTELDIKTVETTVSSVEIGG